ncbi:M15 family metallopeptidase [Paenibacillus tuaregi]|uniref:M15 family metallopeptidase n=1 Tax=Paenibacillus tuaregi TaxID=1816681 RepID=UPI0009EDB631|nr:M15 family metallopeptidase [Paenibacillus tuaregi]
MKNNKESLQLQAAKRPWARITAVSAVLLIAVSMFTACGTKDNAVQTSGNTSAGQEDSTKGQITEPGVATPESSDKESGTTKEQSGDTGKTGEKGKTAQEASADPESEAVLVNKQFGLPDGYEPKDLVYPNVPFTFSEKIDKRKMRKEAAEALEKMFDGAKKDGIYLAGVSAYRSKKTQTALFNRYVKKDGLEKAKTYSAVPGYSEHQTGLAIDVAGSDGKCAAESCFGGTLEADWLKKYAHEYGFIIRYPEGKESITGYKYEPWHIRYVGKEIADEITSKGITLEEYYNAVEVTGKP